jgi:hypothetical protein
MSMCTPIGNENSITWFKDMGATLELDLKPPFQDVAAMPFLAPMKRQRGRVFNQPDLLVALRDCFLADSLHRSVPFKG